MNKKRGNKSERQQTGKTKDSSPHLLIISGQMVLFNFLKSISPFKNKEFLVFRNFQHMGLIIAYVMRDKLYFPKKGCYNQR